MTYNNIRLTPTEGDVLLVTARRSDGANVSATGWVSAIEEYCPPGEGYFDSMGVRKQAVREMTADEKRSYAASLLDSQNPRPR